MNLLNLITDNKKITLNGPVALYDSPDHKVFWVGSVEESIFRCNTYLLQDGAQNYLIDPGGLVTHFPQVLDRVKTLIEPSDITHIIVHHQDPDLCASIPLWLKFNKDIVIMTDPRARVLLPHYGIVNGNYFNVDDKTVALQSGGELKFIRSPFMHFPGAFVTYDSASGFLFSSDICATLDDNWKLVADDINSHLGLMNAFLEDYIACNKAIRGFLRNIKGIDIEAILPQHGSIIKREFVKPTLDYLKDFKCGLDILYPDL
ncbi:MAG: MBL fold metallo-hydrolase [Deltaproteobacteria bacterium]|nr:MBL fold metallo-hydrolase [Deltaproteobacteria bacterium]